MAGLNLFWVLCLFITQIRLGLVVTVLGDARGVVLLRICVDHRGFLHYSAFEMHLKSQDF